MFLHVSGKMPRGKVLSVSERAVISALHDNGMSGREIGRQVGRTHDVVLAYLNDPINYGTKPKSGRPKKLSPRDERTVCRLEAEKINSHRYFHF